MYTSEVEICNLALAALGEPDITSLTEDTKRARLCSRFYAATRNHLLAEFDWPFARKTAELQEVATSVNEIPAGLTAYIMPADCVTPLDLLPIGSREEWIVLGAEFICQERASDDLPVLRYTYLATATGLFSPAFGNILSLGLAARLCNPITQNKTLTKELYSQYLDEKRNAWVLNAAIGVENNSDDDPNQDTFVTGGEGIVGTEGNQRL